MININILPYNQQKVLALLQTSSWIGDFYLAGGTALALQISHRRSVDFDFFTQKAFDVTELTSELIGLGDFEIFALDTNTLHGHLNDVQISFIGYKYPLLDKLVENNFINIASLRDIACMKLSAIASRGSKKDFVDIFFLLKKYTLSDIFADYAIKYSQSNLNEYQLLKSLVYFKDAERQAIPVMLEQIDWNIIKNYIVQTIQKYTQRLKNP